MQIVADEGVDFGIITGLRKNGFNVYSIMENHGGINDPEVLKIANKYNCLLITEDKDFGELTYRLRHGHKGILLIRLADIPRHERILFIIETVKNHYSELCNKFSVLNKNGLRIKNS